MADRIRCCRRRSRPADVARVFDGGALHAQADAEKRNFALAGVVDGVNHALHAALAESAGNQDAVVACARAASAVGNGIDFFGLNPFDDYALVVVREAAVEQRFAQGSCKRLRAERICRPLPMRTSPCGMMEAFEHGPASGCMLRGGASRWSRRRICVVQPFGSERHGNFVDVVHILQRK